MAVSIFHFGDFTLDAERFELCRSGRSIKLEKLPMELLLLLAAKRGQLVTRTEIAERLWGHEVFVDTEHGINTAVRKIRLVLRDDPEQPRYLQTVTGKGYRFIAPLTDIVPTPVKNGAAVHLVNNAEAKASHPLATSVGLSTPQGLASASMPSETAGAAPPRSLSRQRIGLAILAATAVFAIVIVSLILMAQSRRGRAAPPSAEPPIHSLAVLPLNNLSGDPSQDYFADGMTDELITMLAKNSTLRVVSRTSVMQYKGAHRPLPEIAHELGVDGVLEGSVIRSGDKVHMTVQLLQAHTDTHLWAESYDRDTDGAIALPREAALAIAKSVNSSNPSLSLQRYVSPEAHDAYLRGRAIWWEGNIEQAGDYFKKAVELQPDYALAWAGISTYYGAKCIIGLSVPLPAAKQSEAAARKAVELDDSLSWGHLALAGALLFLWDGTAAAQEITRAIELDPAFAEAYHLRAKIYSTMNRHQEAIQAQKKSSEIDPFARPWALASYYLLARQYDAGLAEAHQRLESFPNDASLHEILSKIYRCKGMHKESAQQLEKMYLVGDDTARAEAVRRAFAGGGYKALLRWQISDLRKKSAKQYVSPMDFAYLYAQLGDGEKALSSSKLAIANIRPKSSGSRTTRASTSSTPTSAIAPSSAASACHPLTETSFLNFWSAKLMAGSLE